MGMGIEYTLRKIRVHREFALDSFTLMRTICGFYYVGAKF